MVWATTLATTSDEPEPPHRRNYGIIGKVAQPAQSTPPIGVSAPQRIIIGNPSQPAYRHAPCRLSGRAKRIETLARGDAVRPTTTKLLIGALVLSHLAVGCAGAGNARSRQTYTSHNLVFNSHFAMSSGDGIPRDPWPTSERPLSASESVSYTTTIIDTQGRNLGTENLSYRRFRSTRTGKGRR